MHMIGHDHALVYFDIGKMPVDFRKASFRDLSPRTPFFCRSENAFLIAGAEGQKIAVRRRIVEFLHPWVFAGVEAVAIGDRLHNIVLPERSNMVGGNIFPPYIPILLCSLSDSLFQKYGVI